MAKNLGKCGFFPLTPGRCTDRISGMNSQHIATIMNVDSRRIERANGQSFDLWQVHDSDNNTWVVKKALADYAQTLLGQQAQFTTRHEQKQGAQGGVFDNFYADAIYPLNSPPQSYPNPLDNPQGVTQQQAQAMNAGWNPYSGQQPPPQYVPQQLPPRDMSGIPYGGQPQPGQQPGVGQPQPGMPLQGAVSPQDGQGATQTVYGSSQADRERTLSINRSVAVKAAARVCKGDVWVFWTLLPDLMSFLEEGTLPAKVVEYMIKAEFPEAERVPNASAEGETPSADNEDDIPF